MDLDLHVLTRINPQALSITLWDNSGTGDGTNFPYGWQPTGGTYNVTNPKKSDVATITLTMTYSDGTVATIVLDATQRANYLDSTIGVTILSTDWLGASFLNYPDGLATIKVDITGATIAGVASPWTAYVVDDEAFITFLQNVVRSWVVAVPIPPNEINDVLDTAIANLILDSIYYNVQFGQVAKAQEAFDFLTEITTSGIRIIDYINDENL